MFFIDWKLIHDDLPGVQEAFKNLLVIGAQPEDAGVKYIALSVDDTFDVITDATAPMPQYNLRMGINPDGSRTSRWVKK